MVNVGISKAVAELVRRRSERTKVTANQVVTEFVTMGFVNMMDYMRIGADADPSPPSPRKGIPKGGTGGRGGIGPRSLVQSHRSEVECGSVYWGGPRRRP